MFSPARPYSEGPETYGALLSGGADSAVAAALLLKQGLRVHGIHLRMGNAKKDDALSARRIAAFLGIPLLEIDVSAEFSSGVVRPFIDAYAQGLTPSPCVSCNEAIKFGIALERAGELGMSRLASGHFARIAAGQDGKARLASPLDRARDQSYFLSRLGPDKLARIVFPLADMLRSDAAILGNRMRIPGMDRPSSQEICFVSQGSGYTRLVEAGEGFVPRPGRIVDPEGRVIGTHSGIHRFTVGQRKGLRAGGFKQRMYVAAIDPDTGDVRVGPREALLVKRVRVGGLVWHASGLGGDPFECEVQLRSSHAPARAGVTFGPGIAEVTFVTPVFGAAPGQAAVFRKDGLIIGSGWIQRS